MSITHVLYSRDWHPWDLNLHWRGAVGSKDIYSKIQTHSCFSKDFLRWPWPFLCKAHCPCWTAAFTIWRHNGKTLFLLYVDFQELWFDRSSVRVFIQGSMGHTMKRDASAHMLGLFSPRLKRCYSEVRPFVRKGGWSWMEGHLYCSGHCAVTTDLRCTWPVFIDDTCCLFMGLENAGVFRHKLIHPGPERMPWVVDEVRCKGS